MTFFNENPHLAFIGRKEEQERFLLSLKKLKATIQKLFSLHFLKISFLFKLPLSLSLSLSLPLWDASKTCLFHDNFLLFLCKELGNEAKEKLFTIDVH